MKHAARWIVGYAAWSLCACGGAADVDASMRDASLDAPLAHDGGADAADARVPAEAGRVDADPPPVDATGVDAAEPADASEPADAGALASDAGPNATVAVSHTRELRGVWVATVFRLDFPSRTGLTLAEARAELQTIVDVTATAGLNAIFFQIRPESDALYASALEPWSQFLSGTQGVAPQYDPLAELIPRAHARGVEVHAWMNPYRGLASAGTVTASNHVTRTLATHAIPYGTAVTMDPAAPAVRDHVVAVVRDVVQRYDVDGVHFDDYFYPYPSTPPAAYPDDAQYAAYRSGGGALSKSDWRRDNVNALIRDVAGAVRAEKPWVRFGVSPFGIYRPGMPPGVAGLDAYETLACDSLAWVGAGTVDYLAPQLYWTSTAPQQPFGALAQWWGSQARPGIPIFTGLNASRVGMSGWPVSEFRTQVALSRAQAPSVSGQLWFRYQTLATNAQSLGTTLGTELYATPALPPVVARAPSATVAPPRVTPASGGTVRVEHASIGALRAFTIYRWEGSTWRLVRIVGAPASSVSLAAGRYAISAVDRHEQESPGAVVDLP